MLKNISNLKGAQTLNECHQKAILGGKAPVCEYPLEPMYNPVTHTWSCC
ncbi:hypothetical protein [uncultured Dokdonia sp.]|nr:hypothetical protein [uncultured Dokdonia sp.]